MGVCEWTRTQKHSHSAATHTHMHFFLLSLLRCYELIIEAHSHGVNRRGPTVRWENGQCKTRNSPGTWCSVSRCGARTAGKVKDLSHGDALQEHGTSKHSVQDSSIGEALRNIGTAVPRGTHLSFERAARTAFLRAKLAAAISPSTSTSPLEARRQRLFTALRRMRAAPRASSSSISPRSISSIIAWWGLM